LKLVLLGDEATAFYLFFFKVEKTNNTSIIL